jgi:hypothetical protein
MESGPMLAARIPRVEKYQITGYEFNIGNYTLRVFRRASRMTGQVKGWLIEKIGNPGRARFVDSFHHALNAMWWFSILIGLHGRNSDSPVSVSLTVWDRL